jgi:hypothetical protein
MRATKIHPIVILIDWFSLVLDNSNANFISSERMKIVSI